MDQIQVPFEEIDVRVDDGHRVVSSVKEFLDRHPHRSVPVVEISQSSGVPGPIVKRVLLALLLLTRLKAAFRPRHCHCDRIVGQPEQSVRAVRERASQGQYWCVDCGGPVHGPEDIEIEILFRKPGIDVV
jgi:hypothetical protein